MSSSSVRLVRVVGVLCVSSATAGAQRAGTRPLDRTNLDTTCAPCADFYQFANGTWLKRHTILERHTALLRTKSLSSDMPFD
jgi:putative endopeptidase